MFQAIDLIVAEVEIEFGGNIPKDPPMSKVDNIFKKISDFDKVFPSTDAQCTYADLLAINPPTFLTSSMSQGDILPAGLHVSFRCTNPGKNSI